MAVQTATTIGKRHVTGDLVYRTYVLGTVSNGDTLVIPQNRIESVILMPTTAVALGVTIANGTGNETATLTFLGGPWTGQIGVFSRLG